MGTKIKSVDIARVGFSRRGSVDLEAKAAKGCLKKAGVDPKEVGLLINSGVYRDRHLVEPAMSSFIQQRIGANEEFDGQTSTFSFDLINGGCGMVTGFMVADGFLQSGLTSHVLVAAGDAEPVAGLSVDYDFSPAAAAVLLTPGTEDEGFGTFKTDTQTQYLESFTSRMEWTGEK
jgi:3-oxoacyl-[acyl-carrier-protein] synthase-3